MATRKGGTLTKQARRDREARVVSLIEQGKNVTEIAIDIGVSRQAMWEFCARRGWLLDEDIKGFQDRLYRRDEARREARIARGARPRQVPRFVAQ